MKPIDEPNYTQVPNYIMDHLHEFKSEAELKVVMVIARKTFGWHKERDQISLSQLVTATGMTRSSVVSGLEAAIEHGWIERIPDGLSFSYAVVVQKLDQSNNQTSPESRPEPVQKVDQKVVQKLDTQKKELKKQTNSHPPAVEVFRQSAKAYPAKGQWDAIAEAVGAETKNLERWGCVVAAYVLEGWNPRNVRGMLDFYKRGEMPGKQAGAKSNKPGPVAARVLTEEV